MPLERFLLIIFVIEMDLGRQLTDSMRMGSTIRNVTNEMLPPSKERTTYLRISPLLMRHSSILHTLKR